MKNITFIFLSIIASINSFSQTIQTDATIESIGYTISNLSSFSSHLSLQTKFRTTGVGAWRNGYAPAISAISSQTVIIGSLFELSHATSYELEVTITDSLPTIHNVVVTATVTTMADPIFTLGSDILWVSPTGSGSAYTAANPGKFDQLFMTNYSLIKCGTTILCKGGTYYVGDLQYTTVNTNCSANVPVTIMSAPGEQAIFDGSDSSAASAHPTWVLDDVSASIYKAVLPSSVTFSTLFMLDSVRLFPYATRYPQSVGLGTYYESLSNCDNYFGDGFYRNANTYYVKLSGGASPVGKKVTVSKRSRLLSIYNNAGYKMSFTFRDLEMRNYGKPIITTDFFGNVTAEYSATVFDMRKTKGTIVDHCKFYFNTFSLSFNSNFDSTIIQNCLFKDQTGSWSHGAYKNSSLTEHPDISGLGDIGKYGRILETCPVWFDSQNNTSKSIIIRNNTFDGFVSAISGRGDATGYTNLVYGTDIYDNIFKDNYNVVVPIGNSINFRFFRNTTSRFLVGLSLIENAIGPVYLFRNVFEEILSRSNPSNQPSSYNPGTYINYNGCLGLKNKTWGTVLKLNAGATPLAKRYDLHMIHNTIYSTDSLGYNFYLWEQNWRNIKCINNSFNASYCIHNFESPNANPAFQFNSFNDNYYSATGFVGAVNPNHGTTNCFNDQTLPSLLSHLQLQSGNNDTLSLNFRGYILAPNFVNPAQHDFHLNNTSPIIDKAVIVNNISDMINVNYYGGAPDIGAFENNSVVTSVKETVIAQGLAVFPNPTTGSVNIKASDNFLGSKLIIRNILGEQINQPQTLNNSHTVIPLEGSCGVYFLELIPETGKTINFKLVKN